MSDRLVSGTTTIEAPPEAVFAIVADPRQHPRIDGSGSVKGTVTGPDRLTAKGDRFGMDMKMFGLPYKIQNLVVEFEQDRRIAWRHFGAHRWRYELTPTDDGGTQVTETWDATRYRATGVRRAASVGLPREEPDGHHRDARAAEGRRRGRRDHRPLMTIRTGTVVTWSWGAGTAEGKIVEVHHRKVTRTLSGSEITRNGTEKDPALLIEQEDGAQVLKLRSEVERAS